MAIVALFFSGRVVMPSPIIDFKFGCPFACSRTARIGILPFALKSDAVAFHKIVEHDFILDLNLDPIYNPKLIVVKMGSVNIFLSEWLLFFNNYPSHNYEIVKDQMVNQVFFVFS